MHFNSFLQPGHHLTNTPSELLNVVLLWYPPEIYANCSLGKLFSILCEVAILILSQHTTGKNKQIDSTTGAILTPVRYSQNPEKSLEAAVKPLYASISLITALLAQ